MGNSGANSKASEQPLGKCEGEEEVKTFAFYFREVPELGRGKGRAFAYFFFFEKLKWDFKIVRKLSSAKVSGAVWGCNLIFIDGLGAISDVGENFNIIIESQ